MNDRIPSFNDRPFRERVELRTVFHKVADVFETCSKLQDADKKLLLEEISYQLSQHMPHAAVEPPPPLVETSSYASFAGRCMELAAVAPNDKIWKALITIAQISEAETAADD